MFWVNSCCCQSYYRDLPPQEASDGSINWQGFKEIAPGDSPASLKDQSPKNGRGGGGWNIRAAWPALLCSTA